MTRRFFVEPGEIVAGRVLLGGQEARHLRTVLRLQPGAEVELMDGRGGRYLARIALFSKQGVELEIVGGGLVPLEKERAPLTLAQALLKGQKMDLVVQKATEMGVAAIQPLATARTVADPRDRQRRLERWRRIGVEACKQCGRAVPPEIREVVLWEKFLFVAGQDRGYANRLLFWEEERQTRLADLLPLTPGPTLMVIGPEGGFEAQEVEAARAAGCRTVSLGSRILRAETATLAAVAIGQFLLDNFTM